MTDAEVITTALTAARFFSGNMTNSCEYMKETGLVPQMLGKSRFNRRLHGVASLIYDLQQQLGQIWMTITQENEYMVDSFPVAVCDNIWINNCRLLQGEKYRGYTASKKRYFYGIKIHLIATPSGVPVEWIFLPGSGQDVRGLTSLPLNLPYNSTLYADKGYTDYLVEDNLVSESKIALMSIRKGNSTPMR